MIGFGLENEEVKYINPYLIKCEEIITEYPNNALRVVIEISENIQYEIIITNYIMYLVRNESYTAFDEYEVSNGKWLMIFKESHFLRHYEDFIAFPKDSVYPSIKNHLGIYTEFNLIDIITTSNSEITINKI